MERLRAHPGGVPGEKPDLRAALPRGRARPWRGAALAHAHLPGRRERGRTARAPRPDPPAAPRRRAAGGDGPPRAAPRARLAGGASRGGGEPAPGLGGGGVQRVMLQHLALVYDEPLELIAHAVLPAVA